jgi:hypothetical protein
MAGWKKFELAIPDVPTKDITKVISTIKEFIQVVVSTLETLLNLIPATTDPTALALKAIVNALNKAVESFLEDLGGYALYVPIRKRLMTNFLGFGEITPNWLSDSQVFGSPHSQIKATDPQLNTFIADMNRYNGGNVGFFKTVLDSLDDEGDINRPQFPNDSDYVGGIVIVMGTDFDPLGFLDDIWRLTGMFNAPDSTPKVPRPKNLRGRAITKVLNGSFDVLLKWDPVEVPLVHLEDLGGVMYYPTRYAILRVKNDVRALAASNVIDLMGTRDLQVGTKFNNGNAEVVIEGDLDLSKVSYIDFNVPATSDDSFYYALAWKLKAYNTDESVAASSGSPLDYWYISNVVRITPFPTLPTATPPNWIRTPSVASIFPSLANVLREIVLEIDNYATKLLGTTDLMKQYVVFLKSEIDRYESIISELASQLTIVKALFDLPSSGIYMRYFKGRGGNVFFTTDLAKSFVVSDPNKPPFIHGDEYVTGTILMTGGYLPDVEAFISALELFFGGGGPGGISDLVGQLGQQVDRLETVVFGDDLQPKEPSTADQEKKPTTFDVSMCPLNTCCNPQIPPDAVVFKRNFSVA